MLTILLCVQQRFERNYRSERNPTIVNQIQYYITLHVLCMKFTTITPAIYFLKINVFLSTFAPLCILKHYLNNDYLPVCIRKKKDSLPRSVWLGKLLVMMSTIFLILSHKI